MSVSRTISPKQIAARSTIGTDLSDPLQPDVEDSIRPPVGARKHESDTLNP